MPRNMERNLKVVVNELKNKGYKFNTIYDIGANDGRWTKNVGKPLFGKSSFYQFEANPDCVFRHNDKNIKRFIEVLSDEDDKEIKFYISDSKKTENTGYSYYKENTKAYLKDNYKIYKTKKLDTFVKNKDLPVPQFVKMDTQGSEVDIINGGKKTLEQAYLIHCEVPLFEYNLGSPNISGYIDAFDKLGFRATGIDHIAMRRSLVTQMDITFLRKDIMESIYETSLRYNKL